MDEEQNLGVDNDNKDIRANDMKSGMFSGKFSLNWIFYSFSYECFSADNK